MGIIEKIIDEPLGGAHRDKPAAISAVGNAIGDALDELSGVEGKKILKSLRREKFLEMGAKGLS